MFTGSAKVTVTPCYKFLTCPSAVNTIYELTKGATKEKPDANIPSPQKQHNVEKFEESEAKAAEPNNDIPGENDAKKGVNKIEKSETKDEDQVEETKTEMTDTKKMVTASPVKVNVTTEAHSKSDEVKNTSKETSEVETKKETAKSEVNCHSKELDKNKNVKDSSIEEMADVADGNLDDEEEMTDRDILALMSGGIVLDECSGSEDEK